MRVANVPAKHRAHAIGVKADMVMDTRHVEECTGVSAGARSLHEARARARGLFGCVFLFISDAGSTPPAPSATALASLMASLPSTSLTGSFNARTSSARAAASEMASPSAMPGGRRCVSTYS